ncbi:MAG: helix-turn-helix domain-containing protein [Minisyncoccia bacterium]
MYKDIFTSINLSPGESIVYEYLLKNGESPAGEIIKKTPLKRGMVYKILDGLVDKGLAIEKTSIPSKKQGRRKISHFLPNHPEKLREFIENEKKKLDKAKNSLEANMPALISDFNLASGKPGVRFFEGIEGIKKVLSDSLTTKEIIYSFADLEAVVKYIDKINQEYVNKRDALNIRKKVIFIDSPFARNYLKDYHRDTTFMKFIDYKLYPFNSVMQIYDGKVSYITLSEKSKIGVLIEDKNIYQLHKSIFEYTWLNAKEWI